MNRPIKYPLLLKFFLYQLATLLLGFGIMILFFYIVWNINVSASIEKYKQNVVVQLKQNHEKWRTLKYMDMNFGLNRILAEFKKTYRLEMIDVVHYHNVPKNLTMYEVTIPDNVSDDLDLVIYAKLSQEQFNLLRNIKVPFVGLLLSLFFGFILIAFLSGRFTTKPILAL
jgi:hypothetical protein